VPGSWSRIARGRQFALDHCAQWWQSELYRIANLGRGDTLMIMPADIARARHILPRNRAMPCLHFVRQATRCFGDDLEAACNTSRQNDRLFPGEIPESA